MSRHVDIGNDKDDENEEENDDDDDDDDEEETKVRWERWQRQWLHNSFTILSFIMLLTHLSLPLPRR